MLVQQLRSKVMKGLGSNGGASRGTPEERRRAGRNARGTPEEHGRAPSSVHSLLNCGIVVQRTSTSISRSAATTASAAASASAVAVD